MNYFELIRGFETHAAAQDYADRLPDHARARIVPYTPSRGISSREYLFAVDVHRDYTGGRL